MRMDTSSFDKESTCISTRIGGLVVECPDLPEFRPGTTVRLRVEVEVTQQGLRWPRGRLDSFLEDEWGL